MNTPHIHLLHKSVKKGKKLNVASGISLSSVFENGWENYERSRSVPFLYDPIVALNFPEEFNGGG